MLGLGSVLSGISRVNDSAGVGGGGGRVSPLPPSLDFFWNSLLNFKEHINNIVKRVSNIRKSQNLNLLNDRRKSICLLSVNLVDVLLIKNRQTETAKS